MATYEAVKAPERLYGIGDELRWAYLGVVYLRGHVCACATKACADRPTQLRRGIRDHHGATGQRRVHDMNIPPFTWIVSPTTKLAASVAWKATTSPISSGWPIRPTGMLPTQFCQISTFPGSR